MYKKCFLVTKMCSGSVDFTGDRFFDVKTEMVADLFLDHQRRLWIFDQVKVGGIPPTSDPVSRLHLTPAGRCIPSLHGK